MNAVEFVRNFGWDGAISFTDWYGGNTAFKFLKVKEKTISVHSGDQPYDFHINDLKQLVESYELVNEFDDIEQAKTWIPDMDSDMPYNVRGSKRRFMRDELAQAIRDVESVGGGV